MYSDVGTVELCSVHALFPVIVDISDAVAVITSFFRLLMHTVAPNFDKLVAIARPRPVPANDEQRD